MIVDILGVRLFILLDSSDTVIATATFMLLLHWVTVFDRICLNQLGRFISLIIYSLKWCTTFYILFILIQLIILFWLLFLVLFLCLMSDSYSLSWRLHSATFVNWGYWCSRLNLSLTVVLARFGVLRSSWKRSLLILRSNIVFLTEVSTVISISTFVLDSCFLLLVSIEVVKEQIVILYAVL